MSHRVWISRPTAAPSPSELATYLSETGWSLLKTNESWAEYAKEQGPERRVVIEVPQKWQAGDYGRAAQMFLEDLANLEARELMAVLRDVRAAAAKHQTGGEADSRGALVGKVVALNSQDAEQGGVVAIRGVLDGRHRQVCVALTAMDYQEAIEAHRAGLPVRCLGDLVREGRLWVLSNPREFGKLSEPETA